MINARTSPTMSVLLALVIGLASTLAADAAPQTVEITNEDFGTMRVTGPEQEPKAFVALIADSAAITGNRDDDVGKLVDAGAAVLVLEPDIVMHKLAASDEDECYYLLGDIEDMSKQAQRALKVATYRLPVVIGAGDKGGLIGYLAASQSPVNTSAGGILTGVSTTLSTKLPFCGPYKHKKNGTGFTYEGAEEKAATIRVITAEPLPDAETRLVTADKNDPAVEVVQDPITRRDKVIEAAFAMTAVDPNELSDLPIVELPSKAPAHTLAIFYSGDGGWRDIDKEIAEVLAESDVAVIGVDSLRYFWNAKSPEQIAADIERIVSHYSASWKVNRVALMGYSFGAGILPFVYSKLSPLTQSETVLIALFGLDQDTSFEISVGGYLGFSGSNDRPVRPALATLPPDKVMCFFGSDEHTRDETACTSPELAKATLVERPGGHHFDGNYDKIAELLLKRLGAT